MARKGGIAYLIFCLLLTIAVSTSNEDGSDKFVSSLISHLNKLPGQSYTYKDGRLLSAHEESPFTYKVEVKIEALCNDPEKCDETSLKCNGFLVLNSDTGEIYIIDNGLNCFDERSKPEIPTDPDDPEQTTETKSTGANSSEDIRASENMPILESNDSLWNSEGSSPTESLVQLENNDAILTPPLTDKDISLEKTEDELSKQYIVQDVQKVAQPSNEQSYDSNEGLVTAVVSSIHNPKTSDEEEDSHPVHLTHEVQPMDKATSGEQFVAVRRVNGGGCFDCASEVDVNATGVDKLAALALQHLDRHDNLHRHELNSIVRVQRQVQIVNGVRYILLIDVNFLNMPDKNKVNLETRRCKVSFLEKPWLRISDGSKFRAVVSNNCTEQYLYGDSGEIISNIADISNNNYKKNLLNELDMNYPDSPPLGDQAQVSVPFDSKAPNYDSIANSGKADDILKMVHNKDLQSAKPSENIPIDADHFEDLVSQIIPTKSDIPQKHFDDVPKAHIHGKNNKQENKRKNYMQETKPEWEGLFEDKKEEGIFKPIVYDSPIVESTTVLSAEKKEAIEELEKLLGGLDDIKIPIPEKEMSEFPAYPNSDLVFNVETDNVRSENSYNTKSVIPPNILATETREQDRVIRVDFMDSPSSSLEDDTVISYINRRKRSIFDITMDTEEYLMSLANLAVDTLDKFDDDIVKRVVLNIINVKHDTQKNGILYKMQLKVGYSHCLENENISPKCSSSPQLYQVKLCDVEIYVNSVGHPKVLDAQCQRGNDDLTRKTRSIVGAPTKLKPDNEEIVALALETLQRLEANPNLTNRLKIVNIKRASRQLVSGYLYKIDFETAHTDCLKSDTTKRLLDCGLIEGQNEECHSEIYYQPWNNRNPKEITTKCQKIHTHRRKRGISNDDVLNNLLFDALATIEAESANKNKQKVEKVLYFGRPESSNVLHRIKFTVGITNCSLELEDDKFCIIDPQYGMQKTCFAEMTKHNSVYTPTALEVNCDDEDEYSDVDGLIRTRNQFYNFLFKYNKTYMNEDSEFGKRFQIFRDNAKIIKDLNFCEQGTAKYGINQFADLTNEEFRLKYTGLRRDLKIENNIPLPMAKIPLIKDVPVSFDWRDKGAVTPVKNQGQCGSCWAFSVTGNIEGQWQINKGELLSLSEQELVDCDKMDEGCNGGLPDNAYRAIEQLGGLELENDYPYDAEDEKCQYNNTLARVQISGAVNISSDEDQIRDWLLTNGPISIGINANAMQFYMGGVSHPWKLLCNPDSLDHGVLIVGYGIHNYPLFHRKLPYWLIKNSWGEDWGEQGYYRVYRGDGTCGVNKMASSAIL